MSDHLTDATEQVFERFDKLYEFDRAPVTPDRYESPRHFAAVFAGEHVAGTEFVIGAVFVAWGVSAGELIWGLLIGNLLAVLSWTLICAPISVDTRLTLYWYLRRIAGPSVTALYNVLNAIMFCILSGTMITVSASAVRIAFGVPPQINWYPEDPRFVFVVIGVGAVVVSVAIAGFRRLAQFNEICVPWIFTMFIAGALATLPALYSGADAAANSEGASRSLWRIATEQIWVKNPATGMGFWHVAAFAWGCNLAMHVGLSDMALLRYARRPAYGLLSACGMYLGHFLAWICAGMMGAGVAILTRTALDRLDAGETAYRALGVSGVIAVVLAGWSTSNPTLYRSGLALQAITPGWPRWVVTLAAGAFTTVIACFPFVFTRLLEFVGLYGILLMPIGAIVFVEHYLFPKIGLRRYWLEQSGLTVNWPALVTWIGGVAIACYVHFAGILHLFFLPPPLWLLTAASYTLLAMISGARASGEQVGKPQTPHENEPSPATHHTISTKAASANGPVTTIVGVTAIAVLLACFGLSLWVLLGDASSYLLRLERYKVWLTVASVIHLLACMLYVFIKERQSTQVAADTSP